MYKKGFQYTDEELFNLLQQGFEHAFDELYLRYRDKLVRIVYNRMRSVPIAEEIVQDVFISIWQRRSTLIIHTGFYPYLYGAVRYATLEYIRSHAMANEYIADMLHHTTASTTNSTEDQLNFDELYDGLTKGIDLLPSRSREVFILSRMQHYSTKEIAQKLNISTDTVKYHIVYALKSLRTNLKHFYSTLVVIALQLFY